MSIRIFADHWTKFILACYIVLLGACSASTANLQNSNARNSAAELINDANPSVVTGARNEPRKGPDKVIVISGDTAYSEILAQKAVGADILFHEVVSEAGLGGRSIFWQNYHNSAHTTSSNVANLARSAKPAKLVLYHGLHFGAPKQKVVEEVRAIWDGEVILANDLDIF